MATAEQLWWARLHRALSDVPASRAKRNVALWQLAMCIDAGHEAPAWVAGGFTPSDADHQERERLRVLSELGELHRIGPFPAPEGATRTPDHRRRRRRAA